MMKSLSIYFGYHNLAFLNSFLNILNNYVLVLFWGPRADEVGAEGRGPRIRVEEHKRPKENNRNVWFSDVLIKQ